MNNFGKYITPKQAKKMGDARSLKELEEAAKDHSECDVCGQDIWRYGHGDKTGLCFTCTTGEADASDDYELIEGKNHENNSQKPPEQQQERRGRAGNVHGQAWGTV